MIVPVLNDEILKFATLRASGVGLGLEEFAVAARSRSSFRPFMEVKEEEKSVRGPPSCSIYDKRPCSSESGANEAD